MSELLNPQHEEEKLEIERQKLALESRKVEIELSKSKWTAISVMVSLIAALGTIVYGLYSTNHQSQTAFEVELAKAIASSESPGDALGRARFFMKLFPNRLAKTFISDVEVTYGPSNLAIQTKAKLFEALSKQLDEQRTLDLYKRLFPWTDYGADLTLPDKVVSSGAKPADAPNTGVTATPETTR